MPTNVIIAIVLLTAITSSMGPFPFRKPVQESSFEVAVIKPTPPDYSGGRFTTMRGAHQFVVRNYTVKDMIAAAHYLPLEAISGGPVWLASDEYDIDAATPGDGRPTLDEQMLMLRRLLTDRFKLRTHLEKKERSIYELNLAPGGAKLKESAAPPDQQPVLTNVVYPGEKILLPARNVTLRQFASMLQRAVLDRYVVDKTGLSARYDFDLEWMYDETQFRGALPLISPDAPPRPGLFAALQQQLGLRLQATKGPVDVMVIDGVERPSEN